MSRRKLVRIGVAIVCAVGALTASLGTAFGDSQTVITVAMHSVYTAAWKDAVSRFEQANPSISVSTTFYPGGAPLSSAVATEVAAGNAPDIFYSSPQLQTPTGTPTLVAAGALANLTSQPWAKHLDPADAALAVVNKKVYGWGLGITGTWLLYNKGEFNQHGWKVPTTFKQLLNLCGQMTSAGISIPIAYGGGTPTLDTTAYNAMADSTVYAKASNWTQQRLAGKVSFAKTPGWGVAAQELVSMINQKCFGPAAEAASLSIAASVTDFATGQSPVLFDAGVAGGSAHAETPSLQIGNFPFPGPTAASTRLAVHSDGIVVVNAHTHQLAAVEKFMSFLATPSESRTFNDLAYSVSPYESVTGSIPAYDVDLIPWFKAHKTVTEISTVMPNATMYTNEGSLILGLFTGQTQLPQVPAALDSEWNATNP